MGSAAGVIKVAAKRAGVSVDAYKARIIAGEKYCWQCDSWKHNSVFGIDRSRGDGLSAKCVSCRRGPGGKPKNKLTDIARQARNAVNDAVRHGRLSPVKKLPCMDCGKKAMEYDHHRGYERALRRN